jgi:hypothetical protein
VTEQAIRYGTQEAEQVIVSSIFGAYAGTFPDAQRGVWALANRLPIRFTASELHAAYNQEGVRKATGLDFEEFLQMLFTIGAVGSYMSESSRYYRAQFQYTFPEPLTAVEGVDSLCLHPLFTRYLNRQSLPSLRGKSKVTYPYGSDVTEEYRSELGYE